MSQTWREYTQQVMVSFFPLHSLFLSWSPNHSFCCQVRLWTFCHLVFLSAICICHGFCCVSLSAVSDAVQVWLLRPVSDPSCCAPTHKAAADVISFHSRISIFTIESVFFKHWNIYSNLEYLLTALNHWSQQQLNMSADNETSQFSETWMKL